MFGSLIIVADVCLDRQTDRHWAVSHYLMSLSHTADADTNNKDGNHITFAGT